MKELKNIRLTQDQLNALSRIRQRLFAQFDIDSIVLFGSAARGEADEESDIDLLVLTKRPFDRRERHRITDTIFEVNLEYGTNFSSLVIDRQDWETGMTSVLPIHDEILKEGVAV